MSAPQCLQDQLQNALLALTPLHLEILNESSGHGGYFEGKESHFKVTIVSKQFDGVRAVARHQQVYAVAGSLIAPTQIHALAIHAYTPSEWQGVSPESPLCAHAPKV